MTFAVLLAITAAVPSDAEAGRKEKAAEKAYAAAFIGELEAAYPDTVWALKDLPVKSGLTMGIPWVGPIAEVSTTGFVIEAVSGVSSYGVGVDSVWFSVRAYDTLTFKEAEFDDGRWVIVFSGAGDAKGRDTKLVLQGAEPFGAFKPILDQLLSSSDPLAGYADWSDDVKRAIRGRVLLNGMNKRQAYFVVGEPTGSSVRDESGTKVETWNPR
jgi:hypothetical protein